ncbi:trace amine-associated receptor 1-like [Halichoeres trimaculatus]|uniref:trace amine-associated receptor 1-like n=1 Tax=Halichoeres trimaculatus TaxID=147232 RepID=UPI003D9F8ECD
MIANAQAGIGGVENISDDEIVHAPDQETQDKCLHAVTQRLSECGLTLNPQNCQFNMDSLIFILLTQRGIGQTEERVRAVMETREPENASEMEPEFCFESRNNSCLKIVHPLPLRVVLYIFFVLVIILTVCGNLLVTLSVSYFKQLHTPTNFLIVSLAVSDLLVGMIVMFPGMIHFLESCWYFGDFLCKVSLSSNVTLVTASIINLCFISIDRYYAVCQPLLYRSRITDNTVLVMIVVSWGVSVLTGFGMIFFQLSVLGVEEFYNKNVACEGGCFLFQTKLSSTLSSFLSFYLPGVILLGVYLKILLVAQKQFRSIQRAGCVSSVKPSNTSQTKATKTLAIVLGAFLSFWTPFFVCNLIGPFIGYSVPPEVFETVVWLGLLNSALNPIIYAFFYSWFRKAFHLLISGNMFKSDISQTTLFTE